MHIFLFLITILALIGCSFSAGVIFYRRMIIRNFNENLKKIPTQLDKFRNDDIFESITSEEWLEIIAELVDNIFLIK